MFIVWLLKLEYVVHLQLHASRKLDTHCITSIPTTHRLVSFSCRINLIISSESFMLDLVNNCIVNLVVVFVLVLMDDPGCSCTSLHSFFYTQRFKCSKVIWLLGCFSEIVSIASMFVTMFDTFEACCFLLDTQDFIYIPSQKSTHTVHTYSRYKNAREICGKMRGGKIYICKPKYVKIHLFFSQIEYSRSSKI